MKCLLALLSCLALVLLATSTITTAKKALNVNSSPKDDSTPSYFIASVTDGHAAVVPNASATPVQIMLYNMDIYEQDPTVIVKDPNTPVLIRASCLAKQYELYVAINMYDVQWCNNSNRISDDCPSDGRFQYNTMAILAPSGQSLLSLSLSLFPISLRA